MSNNIADFFDIDAEEKVVAEFNSGSSRKTFVFSGPPLYSLLKDSDRVLCPLVFTTSFTASSSVVPGNQVPSLGTTDMVIIDSGNIGGRQISISSSGLFTPKPKKLLVGNSKKNTSTTKLVFSEKYGFIKRLFYDAINTSDLLKYYLPDTSTANNKSSIGFTTVGASKDDIFTDFGSSEFYKLPIGILAVTLSNANKELLIRYYENVRVTGLGGGISARVGGQASLGAAGMSGMYDKEIKLQGLSSLNLSAGADMESFIGALTKYTTGK